MSKEDNQIFQVVLIAAFDYVFNDSLKEEANVRPILVNFAQRTLLNSATEISKSNNQPVVIPTEEQVNSYVYEYWAGCVDIIREYKNVYGCSASAKRKLFRNIGGKQ